MRSLALALLCARSVAAASAAGTVRAPLPAIPGAFAGARAPFATLATAPASAVPGLAAPAALPVEAPPPSAPAARLAPEGRFVRIGSLMADLRAPGSSELFKALNAPELDAERREDRRAFDGAEAKAHAWPLVGVFHVPSGRVLNGYALGSFGVRGHSDALPGGAARREHGGYTLFVRPDGSVGFMGSGSLPAELTPSVRRAVLRYYGLRPAGETGAGRLRALALRAWDGLLSAFR